MPAASAVFEWALAALDARDEGPVYVQINVMEPHTPGPALREEFGSLFADVPDEFVREYYRKVRQASTDVARFVEELSSRPGMRDALFVITSDHGEGLDSHPGIPAGRFHGSLLYESQLRVPLIFYTAGDKLQHRIVEQTVRLLDVMPTILDLVGSRVPPEIDGQSLTPAFVGERVEIPDHRVAETYFERARKIAVYTDEWKYFENRDRWRGLNPRELQPRGGNERGARSDQIRAKPEVAARLRRFLREWEGEHPRVPPVEPNSGVGELEREHLRALGYAE
jgi:arylsulfatase A-like enzyme